MSSTENKPIIAVFGATGRQGGAVARALHAEGTYQVRAITRDSTSGRAQKLAHEGMQLAGADLNVPDTIANAIEGAYGVFGITDYYNARDKETEHGKNLIEAAKAMEVKHFVWYTFEHSDCWHFESKARVDDYLKESGLPRTSFYGSTLYEALKDIYEPLWRRGDDTYELDFPCPTDLKVPWVSLDDEGSMVASIFKNPGAWIGHDLKPTTDVRSPRELAETLTLVSGKPIVPTERSVEDFLKMRDRFGQEFTLDTTIPKLSVGYGYIEEFRTHMPEDAQFVHQAIWAVFKHWLDNQPPPRDTGLAGKLLHKTGGGTSFRGWAEQHWKEMLASAKGAGFHAEPRTGHVPQ